MVVAAVLVMFLSTACSKKLMPPEIETSNGGVASSESEENAFGGPGDSGFFTEKQVLESSNSSSGNGGSGSATGSDGTDGSSNGSFANPFDGGDSGTQEARLQSFHATSDLKDIHFNFDQYDLDSNSKKVLEENATFLKSNPGMRVEIQGHCDERGTNNYNIALGERRAHSTKKYLVAQGVASSRVSIISYGEEKPFCSDSNENCWHQNRRAHFMVAR